MVLQVSAAEEKQVAKLHLNLAIEKACSDSFPLCDVSRSISLENVEVQLNPQDDEGDLCDNDQGGACDWEAYHYRGIWSQVVELDGIRSIAIVSIDRFLVEYDDPEDNSNKKEYSFSIEAEILGNKGLEAKLRLNLSDLEKLNSITLEGAKQLMGSRSYQPLLYIGPAFKLEPVPCLPDEPCDGDVSKSNIRYDNSIDLILGTLR